MVLEADIHLGSLANQKCTLCANLRHMPDWGFASTNPPVLVSCGYARYGMPCCAGDMFNRFCQINLSRPRKLCILNQVTAKDHSLNAFVLRFL